MKKLLFVIVIVSMLLLSGCLNKPKSLGCCEKKFADQYGKCKLYNASNTKTPFIDLSSQTKICDKKAKSADEKRYCTLTLLVGKLVNGHPTAQDIKVPVCTDDTLTTCIKPNCTAMICGDFMFKPKVAPGFGGLGEDAGKSAVMTSDTEGKEFQNFYKGQCMFFPMDQKLKAIMKNSEGALNRFRIGIGSTFDSYSTYRYFFPVSDKFCHINDPRVEGDLRIDRYMNYIGYKNKKIVPYNSTLSMGPNDIKTNDKNPLPPFQFGEGYRTNVQKAPKPGASGYRMNEDWVDRTMYKFAPYEMRYPSKPNYYIADQEYKDNKLISGGYYKKLDRHWYRKQLSSVYAKDFYYNKQGKFGGSVRAPYECDSEGYECYSGRCDTAFYSRGANTVTGSSTSDVTEVPTDCDKVTGIDGKTWVVCMPTTGVKIKGNGQPPEYTYAKVSVKPWRFAIDNDLYDKNDLGQKWNNEGKCKDQGKSHRCALDWKYSEFFSSSPGTSKDHMQTDFRHDAFAENWYKISYVPDTVSFDTRKVSQCVDKIIAGKGSSKSDPVEWCAAPPLPTKAYPPAGQIAFFNDELWFSNTKFGSTKFIGYAVMDPAEFEKTFFAKSCGIKLSGSYSNWLHTGNLDKSSCMSACKGTNKACGDSIAILKTGHSTADSACTEYCGYLACNAFSYSAEFGKSVSSCVNSCTGSDKCGSAAKTQCTGYCEYTVCDKACGTSSEKSYGCTNYCADKKAAGTASTGGTGGTAGTTIIPGTGPTPGSNIQPGGSGAPTPGGPSTPAPIGTSGKSVLNFATPILPGSTPGVTPASTPGVAPTGSTPAVGPGSTPPAASGSTATLSSSTYGSSAFKPGDFSSKGILGAHGVASPGSPCQIKVVKAEDAKSTVDFLRLDLDSSKLYENLGVLTSLNNAFRNQKDAPYERYLDHLSRTSFKGNLDDGDIMMAAMPWFIYYSSSTSLSSMNKNYKPNLTASPVAIYATKNNIYDKKVPNLYYPTPAFLAANTYQGKEHNRAFDYNVLLPKHIYLLKQKKVGTEYKIGSCDMQKGSKLPRIKQYGWCDACTYSTMAYQKIYNTKNGPYVPYAEKNIERNTHTSICWPGQTIFNAPIYCDSNQAQDSDDYSGTSFSKEGIPRTFPDATLIKNRMADFQKSGVLPILDLTDKSNWQKKAGSKTYKEYDFQRLLGNNGATIVIVSDVSVDSYIGSSGSFIPKYASDTSKEILERSTAVRTYCPRCLVAVRMGGGGSKSLSKLNTTLKDVVFSDPRIRLQIDLIVQTYNPTEMKYKGATAYDWADEVVANMSSYSQVVLQSWQKPTLITHFFVYDDPKYCKPECEKDDKSCVTCAKGDKKCTTKCWNPKNYGILFQTIIDKQNTLVKSGLLGINFNNVRSPMSSGIESGSSKFYQSLLYYNQNSNKNKEVGIKEEKFAGLQKAMERLSAGWPIAVFSATPVRNELNCTKCSSLERAQPGLCSSKDLSHLTCSNGVKCTLPPSAPSDGNMWKCPVGSVISPCNLCNETSTGQAKSGGWWCEFNYANGSKQILPYANVHINSDLYADVLGGMPNGQKCCIRNVKGLNYTYNKKIYRQPINSPIVFSKHGDPTADCGIIAGDTLPFGMFCGLKVPVNDYDINCSYDSSLNPTFALPPKTIQSMTAFNALLGSQGQSLSSYQYTSIAAGTGSGGFIKPGAGGATPVGPGSGSGSFPIGGN